MKKCALCKESFDPQFLTEYTRQDKKGNVITNEKVLICDYCDLEESEIDNKEENKIIEVEGRKYYYSI